LPNINGEVWAFSLAVDIGFVSQNRVELIFYSANSQVIERA
jgi:hypothetical protein